MSFTTFKYADNGEYASLSTNLTGSNNDLTFKAKAAGTGGNSITIAYVDPAGNNQPLSVGVVGSAITVNLATDGSSNPISTAAEIDSAIATSAAANALVSVVNKAGNDGTGVATAMGATALTGGGAADEVDFLMAASTPTGYIGITRMDPEILEESTSRSKMEANSSWPTFNYFVAMLVLVEADMLCQNSTDFMNLKIATDNVLLVDPVGEQTERLHGQLRMRPAGQSEDWLLPVQVAVAPKYAIPAISPSAASFSVTFKAFRPYWLRETTGDYKWYA